MSRYQKGKTNLEPIWILLKQETVSGNGISWAICKSAHHSREITMPAPHHSVFYRPDALPAAQPTASKHSRVLLLLLIHTKVKLYSGTVNANTSHHHRTSVSFVILHITVYHSGPSAPHCFLFSLILHLFSGVNFMQKALIIGDLARKRPPAKFLDR